MAEFKYRISKARKEYACANRQRIGCGGKILPGDTYFCVTVREDARYKSIRYCMECCEKLYPEEMQNALSTMKRSQNRKSAGKKIARIRFLKKESKKFRSNPTPSEEFLWDFLRNGRLGFTFYRQRALHGYVVDFWCPEKFLAVELDGHLHRNHREKDKQRDDVLRSHGIRILRFPAAAVFSDMHKVLEAIRENLAETRNR